MRILAIGDIVGKGGCEHLRNVLPGFKRQEGIDLVIANGENSAVGNGILPSSAEHIFDSGVNIITTGNHVFKRQEIYDYLEETPYIIRPANYPASCPGKGYTLYEMGRTKVAVINLLGVVYTEPLRSPFDTLDELLDEIEADIILVDFHAEATSEKRALGFYADGRVTALFGTHTHVPTADEQILPQGTGYLTDLGMTGPIQSVLGVLPERAIRRFRTHLPTRFENASGPCLMQGLMLDINDAGNIVKINRINL